jgi:hypothetical protein
MREAYYERRRRRAIISPAGSTSKHDSKLSPDRAMVQHHRTAPHRTEPNKDLP